MKKSLKQQMAERVYAVQVTVHVHALNPKDAQSYLETALRDWSKNGQFIPAMQVTDVTQSDLLFLSKEAAS